MQPAAHPTWMATGFPIVCAGALVHAQGGEMQPFFPCSNPACDEGLVTLKHEFWHCLPAVRVVPRDGWRLARER